MQPEDYSTPLHVLHFFLIVAGVCATAFPLVYAKGNVWYRSTLGRVLMLHGVALALAVDLSILFTYWRTTDLRLHIWIDIGVIGLVAFATLALLYLLLQTQYSNTANQPQRKQQHDGNIEMEPKEGKMVYAFVPLTDPHDWTDQDEVVFKVVKRSPE